MSACRQKIISNHVNRSAYVLNENVKTLMKLGSGLTFIRYLPQKIFATLLHIHVTIFHHYHHLTHDIF